MAADGRRPSMKGHLPAAATGLPAAAVCLLIASAPGGGGTALAATTFCVVAALGLALANSYRVAGRWALVLASPLAVAAGTWFLIFVLRPLELFVAPQHASRGLGQLGFEPQDIIRATAIGGLGCALWLLGYVVGLGGRARTSPQGEVHQTRPTLSGRGAASALIVGTLLWAALFLRQGGPSALADSAVSLRAGQNASFYGFIGVWLVQGTTLIAFAMWLVSPTRTVRIVVATGVLLSLGAMVALQLRAPAAFALATAAILYLRERKPTTRRGLQLGAAAVVAFLALGFLQQVREFTHRLPTAEAISVTTRTPLWAAYVSDLSTFDSFVAIDQLVPESIPYLHGSSLVEIPLVLVPREVWADKPLGIDTRAGAYLYPGTGVANPVSLQGELYWNGGLGAVIVGATVLGLAFGRLARAGLDSPPGSIAHLLYAVAVPFSFAFLTRGLAVMFASLVLAMIGTTLAAVVVSPSVRHRLADRVGRPPQLASARNSG
jgi:hypothetical protein